jgi:hypothetical protein
VNDVNTTADLFRKVHNDLRNAWYEYYTNPEFTIDPSTEKTFAQLGCQWVVGEDCDYVGTYAEACEELRVTLPVYISNVFEIPHLSEHEGPRVLTSLLSATFFWRIVFNMIIEGILTKAVNVSRDEDVRNARSLARNNSYMMYILPDSVDVEAYRKLLPPSIKGRAADAFIFNMVENMRGFK